ncbi:MAG: DUF2007 domain-containing protein [Flammeovirgaceae bacterium]|nr:DUF2007 domain-containing protein [Flammeovirgaceae bacterium]
MKESEEKIVVYDSYATNILANLVKTKLDAYGIPCFLSGEEFNNMFPIKNDLMHGVRLHIFECDRDQVNQIINSD